MVSLSLRLYHWFVPRRTMYSGGNLTLDSVRGMTSLDREKFAFSINVPVLNVPQGNLSKIMKLLKKYFFKLEEFKPVQTLEENEEKIILKCIHLNPDKVKTWTDISEEDRKIMAESAVTEEHYSIKEIKLTYDNWRFDDVFKAVLPSNHEIVSGFSQIGHIIHLNLKDHLMEYRPIIGQVLLDKIKTCRTVVNKLNNIDNTYRNFKMEAIAGEEDYNVKVKENNCIFEFDFSKVYWNPRLAMEHERVLKKLKHNDVLFDVFCGVGPFAIPAAKDKFRTYANDLNPDAYKWLNHNAKLNNVDKLLKTFNEDGGAFIRVHLKNFLLDICNGTEKLEPNAKVHVTMNLPGKAVDFLRYFYGLLDEDNETVPFVVIHVYCFVVGDAPENLAVDLVAQKLDYDIRQYIVDVLKVRRVAPKKEMMRVSFMLPKIVFCGHTRLVQREIQGDKGLHDENEDSVDEDSADEEPPPKKPCPAAVPANNRLAVN